MIIACPKCAKKFALDDSKAASPQKYKCTGCATVFGPGISPKTQPIAAKASHKVVVAADNEELRSSMAAILRDARIEILFADDGNAAIDSVASHRPELLVLDAAIKGLFSFSVCQMIKSNSSLEKTKIILVSSVYNKKRYKREPAALYGAEAHIETHMFGEELAGKAGELLGFTIGAQPPAADDKRAEHAAIDTNVHANGEPDKAKKLARVIAADIFMYNRTKLSSVPDAKAAYAVFSKEIEEGLKYFRKRHPSCAGAEDYILEAISECLKSIAKEAAPAAT